MIDEQILPLKSSDAAFPESELDLRIKNLQGVLRERSIDLYITTSPENIFYLTAQQTPGYYAPQFLCVPQSGPSFLVIRDLEYCNARVNTYLDDIIRYSDNESASAVLAQILTERGWREKRIAIDKRAWFLTVEAFLKLEKHLGPLKDAAGWVEGLRVTKSDLELTFLGRSMAATEAGMRTGIDIVAPGASENDVAAAVMQAMIAGGSEYVGMEPLISSGYRSGIPHATWRRRRIEAGDVVTIECSAAYNRYHSGLFRSVAVGHVPKVVHELFSICLEAFEAGLRMMKPGNRCADVHSTVQAVIDQHGCTARFRKKSGYSLGISFAPDWGEGNVLSLNHDVGARLRPGMVFHLPIALREYGAFTVAVSETIVIKDRGSEVLGTVPRELFTVPA